MSITKSQNARVMSEEAIQYLCKCINLVNSLPTSVIDNLHLADNLTFSSTKIDRLLTTLKEDCNKYTDSIIANFSRLELRVVTDEADMNEHNKLYLIKKAGETSYSQYVIVTNDSGVDEKILLGTCDISMTDYLKITDASKTYCKQIDFDSLNTTVTNIKTEIGTDTLTTTSKTLKGGINELNTKVGSDKLNTTSTNLSGAVNELNTKVGSDTLKTSSQNLSGAVNELNTKKLNKSDKNKFDDIIDIDSVSLKEYILENCTEEKVYHLIARSTCTDTPKANAHFYVTVEKVGSFTHKVKAKELNTNEEYTCTYRSDTSKWTGWDKICTTSVADVAKTTINIITNDYYVIGDNNHDAHNWYKVIDGQCYAEIFIRCIKSGGQLPIFKGLPKNICPLTIGSVGSESPISTGITAFVNSIGNLIVQGGTVGSAYMISFVYKVEES